MKNDLPCPKADRNSLRRDVHNTDRPAKLCFSVEELARELCISRGGAYALVHSEGFPAVHIGCRIVIPATGLEQWLLDQAGASRPFA